MNDENKVPVPDEAQASPAHAEDDIATLEREARVKREAELLNAQDDDCLLYTSPSPRDA